MASLCNFQSIRPSFETSQQQIFAWLIDAHSITGNREEIAKKLMHVGCSSQYIEKRGHILGDFLHTNWKEMEIYRLHEKRSGLEISERLKLFDTFVLKVFEQYYPSHATPPDDLIHVSCTGYVSPSGAQKIVSRRGWNTMVTHAYHMGCYAAFPAIRMGEGFLKNGRNQVDIVHTEICSLHLNPNEHNAEKLVVESLFADGFIKYSVCNEPNVPHVKILAVHEEMIPNSEDAMSWSVAEFGNQITLSKKVPIFIVKSVQGYLKNLCVKAKLQQDILQNAYFAIHPGGPKILNQIQKRLSLKDAQLKHSYEILKKFGNMSSATLPHIWDAILQEAKDGDLVVSLAFGPGLSIAGSVAQCGL